MSWSEYCGCVMDFSAACQQHMIHIRFMIWFTYLGDMACADGGCEAAVTARTGCGLVKFRVCGQLLYMYILYTWWAKSMITV